jgi:hypothetical protein
MQDPLSSAITKLPRAIDLQQYVASRESEVGWQQQAPTPHPQHITRAMCNHVRFRAAERFVGIAASVWTPWRAGGTTKAPQAVSALLTPARHALQPGTWWLRAHNHDHSQHNVLFPTLTLSHGPLFGRRATSHLRYLTRRRPNIRLAGQLAAATAAIATGSAVNSLSDRPAGHAVDSGGVAGEGQVQQLQLPAAAAPAPRPTNRRMRRRPALLHEAALQSAAQPPPPPAAWAAAPPPGPKPAAPADGRAAGTAPAAVLDQGQASSCPRKLETHLWHARRMTMGSR